MLNLSCDQRCVKGNKFFSHIKKKLRKKKQETDTLDDALPRRTIKSPLDKVLSIERTDASPIRSAGFPLVPVIQCVSRLALYL